MGGTRCAVATCNNTYKKIKKAGQIFSLHSFPHNSELRDYWAAACRRGDKWNPLSSHICSEHFTSEDFESDQMLQLWTGIKWKPQLKPGSIPSLKLPGDGVPLTNSYASKKLVSPQAFLEQDPCMATASTKNEILDDSTMNLKVNVPSTITKNRLKCVRKHSVHKFRNSKESYNNKKTENKEHVIYSCSEFELYVSGQT